MKKEEEYNYYETKEALTVFRDRAACSFLAALVTRHGFPSDKDVMGDWSEQSYKLADELISARGTK